MPARVLLSVLLFLLGAVPDAARSVDPRELPAVARPRFELDGRKHGSGTAFFVPSNDEIGVAAVTTAHSFDRKELFRAGEVVFRRGHRGDAVSFASRLLAPPGRPFSAPGGTLRDDFLVFALDAVPREVRVLRLDPGPPPAAGQRVRLLGVPAASVQDEDDLFGTVHRVGETRIEVDLDVPADLRGWGGAPVLRHPEGTVVGILQAAWPERDRLRLGVAPIDGVREALAHPLDGGLGRPFAAFQGTEPRAVARASEPEREGGPQAPAQPTAPAEDARSAPETPGRTGSSSSEASGPTPSARAESASAPASGQAPPGAPGDADADAQAPDALSAVSARRGATPRDPDEPLLGRAGAVEAELVLEIETPSSGAVLGEAPAGAFVAGRALAVLGELKRFDVVIVIDTSGSAATMTGEDINGNGIVGENGLSGLFGDTDPGDSVLAAEIAAARNLLQSFDPRTTRVGLVSFAGEPPRSPGLFTIGSRSRPAAIVEEPLTRDYALVERSLTRILERGPEGMTNMAEAVDRAWLELTGLREGLSEVDPDSEKIVLFLTDGQPTLPYDPVFEADNVKAVLRAADRAKKMDVTIHAFAIGPEALDGPVATVEMAERTGGTFTPVREPGDIMNVIENVSLADVEGVTIRNLSTEEDASQIQISPDGSFAALVPLRTGRNRIEVVARTPEGQSAREQIEVNYAPGAPPPTLPRELLAKRTRLLQRRLVELRRERVEAERAEVERTRKELQIEIEEERQRARERAEAQRKELRIEPERRTPDAGSDAPRAGKP